MSNGEESVVADRSCISCVGSSFVLAMAACSWSWEEGGCMGSMERIPRWYLYYSTRDLSCLLLHLLAGSLRAHSVDELDDMSVHLIPGAQLVIHIIVFLAKEAMGGICDVDS